MDFYNNFSKYEKKGIFNIKRRLFKYYENLGNFKLTL